MRIVRRKLLQLIPILLIVTFVTFALLNLLPGDVTLELLGSDATPSAIERNSASAIRSWCVTCAGLARRSRVISDAPSSPANPSWRHSRGVSRCRSS